MEITSQRALEITSQRAEGTHELLLQDINQTCQALGQALVVLVGVDARGSCFVAHEPRSVAERWWGHAAGERADVEQNDCFRRHSDARSPHVPFLRLHDDPAQASPRDRQILHVEDKQEQSADG